MKTTNHEYYVSLEVAKLLKEAGFDVEGMSYYQNGIFYQYLIDKEQIIIMNHNSAPNYMEQYSAPTLDVAQKWLREKWDLIITIDYNYKKGTFLCKVYSKAECLSILFDFLVYEEAQEAGIKKALEMILEKGE